MTRRIINHITDQDLYTLTVGQLAQRQHKIRGTHVLYEFTDRRNTIYPKDFALKMREQIDAMGDLRYTPEEIEFLRTKLTFLAPSYIEWLERYQPDPSHVFVEQYGDGQLHIEIEGPWHQTIWWEVPLLATTSELYFRVTGQQPSSQFKFTALEKAKFMFDNGVKFADFGTRRRFSYAVQDAVIKELIKHLVVPHNGGFVGTSNIHFAMKYGLRPIGTMSHQLISVLGALFGVRSANGLMLELWSDEYRGSLGTALPDTFTTDMFLLAFDTYYAKLFDGLRQDSGNPFAFVNKVVDHYRTVGVDPSTKTLIFSDGLDPQKAVEILQYCQCQGIGASFGIGTNLMNDVGVTPLNIVIKAVGAKLPHWPVMVNATKLSDTPGKHTGDPDTVARVIADVDEVTGKAI